MSRRAARANSLERQPNGTHFRNPQREQGRVRPSKQANSLADAAGYFSKVSAIGRQPQAREPLTTKAPAGRQIASLPPRWGFKHSTSHSSQGLTPLAIRCRRFAAQKTAPLERMTSRPTTGTVSPQTPKQWHVDTLFNGVKQSHPAQTTCTPFGRFHPVTLTTRAAGDGFRRSSPNAGWTPARWKRSCRKLANMNGDGESGNRGFGSTHWKTRTTLNAISMTSTTTP